MAGFLRSSHRPTMRIKNGGDRILEEPTFGQHMKGMRAALQAHSRVSCLFWSRGS